MRFHGEANRPAAHLFGLLRTEEIADRCRVNSAGYVQGPQRVHLNFGSARSIGGAQQV